MQRMEIGTTFQYTRTFLREEILRFAEFSGDRGIHHIREDGKIIAHGLFVATLPTKLGGDLNFLAKSMTFQFLEPVYEGDTVVCTGRVEKAIEQKLRIKYLLSFTCVNQDGKTVMTGNSSGHIWKEELRNDPAIAASP